MGSFEKIFGPKSFMTISETHQCEQGAVKLRYARDVPGGKGAARDLDYAAIHLVTTKVKIEVMPADMAQGVISATLTAAEAIWVLGGTRPSTETFAGICERLAQKWR